LICGSKTRLGGRFGVYQTGLKLKNFARTSLSFSGRALAARLAIHGRDHPNMLRHACGYALANAGHDTRALQAYLGHIRHTVRYSELAADRLKNFWR
jgi:site-specific recombinase XerD